MLRCPRLVSLEMRTNSTVINLNPGTYELILLPMRMCSSSMDTLNKRELLGGESCVPVCVVWRVVVWCGVVVLLVVWCGVVVLLVVWCVVLWCSSVNI